MQKENDACVARIAPLRSVFKPGSTLTLFVSFLFWTYVAIHSILIGFPIALLIRCYHTFFDREKRMLQHKWTTIWAYHYHKICPFQTTHVIDKEKIAKLNGQAVIFVCNHQSTTDIMLMYGIETHFKWVSKKSNFSIPLIGWNMSLNDYVPVERDKKDSIQAMFAHCKRHLSAGSPLVFFPEGSRSVDGTVKPFKHGAFSLAIEAQVPIVPLVLDGTSDCLTTGKGTTVGVYNGGGWDLTLKVLDPIFPSAFGDSPEALSVKVRGRIADELDAIAASRNKIEDSKKGR
mmetsp:Transcript_6826/g.13476  ORF Transcript_6826/g.13476 Transcript_6826/m.13476 type:complete len:288 (-) Transcript_6826:67-930(-)